MESAKNRNTITPTLTKRPQATFFTTILALPGNKLALGDAKGGVYIQNMADEKAEPTLIPALFQPTAPVCQLLYSAKSLVSCHTGNSDPALMHLTQWNIEKNHWVQSLGKIKGVVHLGIQPNGTITGIKNQRIVSSTDFQRNYHVEPWRNVCAAIPLSDHEMMVVDPYSINCWNKKTNVSRIVAQLDKGCAVTALSVKKPGAYRVAIGFDDGKIKVIDTLVPICMANFLFDKTIPKKDANVTSVAWLPNGDLIAVLNEKYLQVWDVEEQKVVHCVAGKGLLQIVVLDDGRAVCLTDGGKSLTIYTFPRVEEYNAQVTAQSAWKKKPEGYNPRHFSPARRRLLDEEEEWVLSQIAGIKSCFSKS